MTDGQQTSDNGAAGGNTPAPVSTGSDLSALVSDLQKKNTEWENRYNGQQGALTKKANEVKDLQIQVMTLNTEYEGFKGTQTALVSEWENKYKTVEQQFGEQSKKLAQYELTDKVRSLVHGEFVDLAASFDSDPLVRAGIIFAAQSLDEAGLKKALTDSVALRKGQTTAAIDLSLSGSTTPPPGSGAPAGMTEQQILDKLLAVKDLSSKEFADLQEQLNATQRKKP